MKILWFPRLQYDVDHLHLVTWLEMARELERRGHEVRVAVAGLPRGAAPPGWIRLPLLRVKGLRLPFFALAAGVVFPRQYAAWRPDVVVLDVYTAWLGLPFARSRRRARWIVDNRSPIAHTSLPRGPARRRCEAALTATAYALARRRYDGMTTITATYRDRVAARYGFPRERIGVWGSGVDVAQFDPARHAGVERPAEWRGRFVVMQHGEQSFNRGLLETVRALREPGLENVVLVLLGDGPARGALERLARECGVAERVHLLPPVSHAEVPARLAWCDVGIMAYPVDDYWDSNDPLKLSEYLAMGKVVVCTPLAAVRAAGSAAHGLEIIPDARPTSIARGLRRCLADPDLAARGRAGRARVVEQGTWAAQAERWLAFVRGLGGSP